jgi:hypothetical protein
MACVELEILTESHLITLIKNLFLLAWRSFEIGDVSPRMIGRERKVFQICWCGSQRELDYDDLIEALPYYK